MAVFVLNLTDILDVVYRLWIFRGIQNYCGRVECNFRDYGTQRIVDANAAVDWSEIFLTTTAICLTLYSKGYIPGAEALTAVERLACRVKHARPSLVYLLDRTPHIPPWTFDFSNFLFFISRNG